MAEILPETLFAQWFWPFYPPDVQADLEAFRQRDANPANNPRLYEHMAQAAELFAHNASTLLGLPEPLPQSPEGLFLLSRKLDRTLRDRLLQGSSKDDPNNAFTHFVLHGTMFLGEVIVRSNRGRWSLRRPAWESLIFRQIPGESHAQQAGAIRPFQWFLKHLSDAHIDHDTLAARYKLHVELATAPIESLPVLATPRKLPALKQPSYAQLVAFLQKHLPELKDLGEGFPSPQEFTARQYETLTMDWFHAGRLLVLHAQRPAQGDTPACVELHWLTAHGWDHSDSFPCDAKPPYFARKLDDVLELTFPWQGRPFTHRVSFRGHGI